MFSSSEVSFETIFLPHIARAGKLQAVTYPLLWKRGQPQGTNPQLGCDLLHLPTSYVECSDGWGQLSFSPLHPMQQTWIQVQPRHIPSSRFSPVDNSHKPLESWGTSWNTALKRCVRHLFSEVANNGPAPKSALFVAPPFFLEESF